MPICDLQISPVLLSLYLPRISLWFPTWAPMVDFGSSSSAQRILSFLETCGKTYSVNVFRLPKQPYDRNVVSQFCTHLIAVRCRQSWCIWRPQPGSCTQPSPPTLVWFAHKKGQLLTFWALAFLRSYTCLVTQMVHYYHDTQHFLFYRSYCIYTLHWLWPTSLKKLYVVWNKWPYLTGHISTVNQKFCIYSWPQGYKGMIGMVSPSIRKW